MKISLGTWAFSFGPYAANPVPFGKIVRRGAEAGYEGVEICGFPPHITLEDYPTTASRRKVANLLRDLNLAISGYSADFSVINPTVAANREKYLDRFRRLVELCADLGSPSIRVDTVAAPGSIDDDDYAAAMDRIADIWHVAAGIALPAGVRLLWEFEPGFAFNKVSEAIALHERVAHPNFDLIFDSSHAYMCGVVGARQQGPRERVKRGVLGVLEKLAGRVGHVHLIDSDGTLYAEETSTHRPFGEGKIDFDSLIPALLQLPKVEWWCIDHSFWPGAWDLVEASLRFVQERIRKARKT